MFDRGHLDHIALDVADRQAFENLRRRLVEHGASDGRATDGRATDFGIVRTVNFRDPDAFEAEIALWQDGRPLRREESASEPLSGRRRRPAPQAADVAGDDGGGCHAGAHPARPVSEVPSPGGQLAGE